MSMITLQLPEYVDDLTINSDEKLNFEVRVWFFSLAMFWSSFSQTKLGLCHYFFVLSTAPRIRGRSDYQQVKIHNIHSFNDSRRIKSCC